jgi:hypothetical protein
MALFVLEQIIQLTEIILRGIFFSFADEQIIRSNPLAQI